MRIKVRASLRGIKSGLEARAPSLEVVAHGSSEQDALEALRVAIRVWSRCLQRVGRLEAALAARGVLWEPTDDGIDVDLLVDSSV